jgi:hypothetical protein
LRRLQIVLSIGSTTDTATPITHGKTGATAKSNDLQVRPRSRKG